jgi:hypothetical protein
MGCKDIVNSDQCNENVFSDKECLWVEDERTEIPKCQEIKTKCEDISTSITCEKFGVVRLGNVIYECVWVSEESEGQKCQGVKDSCKEITIGSVTCEKAGAAKLGSTMFKCIWVLGKCFNNVVGCSDLFYFVCENYSNISEGILGLSVFDSPCFFNGENKEEMSCVSKSNFSEERCSVLKSMKICNRVEEIGWTMRCAWIKVANISSCVVDESAELCEYYVELGSCKKTSTGEMCSWDSLTGKCTGGLKSCDSYKSYNACSAVGDRCFWNGNSTSLEGECLSLEKEYTCSNLRYTVCNTYGDVEGLIVVDRPCFFNNPPDNNDGLHCVTARLVTNTSCSNIKTNNNVGIIADFRYCDNAQFLFAINGENGLGCDWDYALNICFDRSLNSTELLENCSGYTKKERCNYHISSNGEKCFWNPGDDGTTASCLALNDVVNCSAICTNDLSGIDTHTCEGNVIVSEVASEMCKWEGENSGTELKSCRCEGIPVPESCGLLNVELPSDCNVVLPNENSDECFFNKNAYEENDIVECTDVDVIMKCNDIQNNVSCNMARRIKFPNLESDLTVSSLIFICLWDKMNNVCSTKEIPKIFESEDEINIILIVIIVVSVGGCILLSILIVGILLLKKRYQIKNRRHEYEMRILCSDTDNNNLENNRSNSLGYFNT